ncbi:syntaxin-7-like [Actinia tenebrosa]|uniref:Syntaxin-7-like n=1 Tax=Actinia tenebrosa TaxID=6105 RepID=A0A6P8HWI9_ACTTE|nr:syntaxin-7-like [Actinia tenebrosa]
MSRGEFGGRDNHSYGAIGGGYDSSSRSQTGDSQEKFQKLSDSVSSNIFQINSNTSALERILRQISTGRDEVPQEKIHRLQQGTNKLATQTTNLLKSMSSLCGSSRQLRIQHERLKEEFRESVSRYYSAQNKIAEQEKLIVKSASIKQRQERTAGDFESDKMRLVDDESKREADQQLLQQIAVDEAIMYEREDRIRQIESDILDINEIFRDLAGMVYEQGEMIDSIEGNVEKAHDNVSTANIQLEKASKYQKAARKKMCCLLVICVLVAGAVALILYFSLKH